MILKDGFARYGIMEFYSKDSKRIVRGTVFGYTKDEILEKVKEKKGTLIRIVPSQFMKEA